MSQSANATFNITGWDEKPCDEIAGDSKLTRAHVTKVYSGDIEGEATVEYVMMHRADGDAEFVGYERVICRLAGRSGSFVLRHKGTFEGGTVKSDCVVVTGSATGELTGLRGESSFAAEHAEQYPITLKFDLD